MSKRPYPAGTGGPPRSGRPVPPRARGPEGPRHRLADGSLWLYGQHAVLAALANPDRVVLEVLATRNSLNDLPDPARARVVETDHLAELLPPGAVHQGLAIRVQALPGVSLPQALGRGGGLALVLDQVTDPQNVGAVFRSCAAFEASAVISQDRHAAPASGAMAKAAAGALETVADVRVVNIAQALRDARDLGWRVVGLSGEAESDLDAALDGTPTVLVLGAEGRGLRPLVAETCDALARIPIGPGMESLNVSVAAGVALASAARARASAAAAALAKRAMAAARNGHAGAFAECLAPGARMTGPAGPLEDAAAVCGWLAAAGPDARPRVREIRHEASGRGYLVRIEGVWTGEGPNGEDLVGARFLDLVEIEDDRIRAVSLFDDLAARL